MAGKRSVKSAEIRTPKLKQVGKSVINVYNDVCDIYGNNEVYFATVSRWMLNIIKKAQSNKRYL
jgi:hypothetical protein